MNGLIKIEDEEMLTAFYEAGLFGRAMGIMRDVMSLTTAIETLRKHDSLYYAAWSMAMQTYPQIREDVDNGIQWIQIGTASGNVFLRRQG